MNEPCNERTNKSPQSNELHPKSFVSNFWGHFTAMRGLNNSNIYPIFSQVKYDAFIFDLSKFVEYFVLNALAIVS